MKNIFAVGTGPGASEYLTLQAVNAIKNADVIFSPNNDGKHLAFDTAKDFILTDRIIQLQFKMGTVTEDDYQKAATQILEHTAEGETGIFLTIGDPMLYSTFIYLIPYLKNQNVNLKVISGVPSFVAAAAVSLTPLTLKGEVLTVTDHLTDDILMSSDSIALLKTHKQKSESIKSFEKNNFNYVYVRRATLENELVLKDTKKEKILEDKDYISLLLAKKKDNQ